MCHGGIMTRKNPSRVDISAIPTEISKWQKASVDLVQLKFRIHDTLKRFSEEERQSDQYRELTDILRGIIVHVIDETVPTTTSHGQMIIQNISEEDETTQEARKGFFKRFWNWQTLIIGCITGIATGIAPYIPDIIRAVFSIFTGHP
jgi:hypothetical protein